MSVDPTAAIVQGEEPDSARLERALHWNSEGHWPWKCIFASAGLHAFVLLPGLLVGLLVAEEPRPEPAKETITQIFVPAPSAPPEPASPPAAGRLESLPPPQEGPAVPEVAVDLRSMELAFAADVGNQLPDVIRSQRGMLALLDKDDAGIARYLIQPPGWEAREEIVDVSSKLRILMDPPQKWPVFREVAERYGIDLTRYRASAVFDIGYRRCLQDAIRSRAAAEAKASGRVLTARLAFRTDRPCGIEVLEVSLATNPPEAR